MKFFYRQLFVAFLLCGCAINAKAVNDTLTIGEAFNWQVGDSLVFGQYTWITFASPPSPPVYNSFELMEFSVNSKNVLGDTIEYIVIWTDNTVDTLLFPHLDSLVTKFSRYNLFSRINACLELEDMPTCDSSTGCTVNQFTPYRASVNIIYQNFEVSWSLGFTERIGLQYAAFDKAEYPIYPGGCGVKLLYHKSGTLAWMDSSYYFPSAIANFTASAFHLSPNPTTDALTITADNQTPVTISIYSATGVLMGSYLKPAAGALSIPVNNLPPAYYMLKLSDSDGLSATKGFIVTR